MGGPAGVRIGRHVYTWSQFAALPTAPAKLWPIVKADLNVGLATDKDQQAYDFETIGMLLDSDPLSPGMQKALYELLEKIPGVTVVGAYTDSLGRTGTALRVGSSTLVIDSSNGRILADLEGSQPLMQPGCVRACGASGDKVTVHISTGPATSAPNVKPNSAHIIGS
jgi:hypothetical protein